jgi:hypothetical protein
MTRDEIIALAIEAGFGEPVNHKDWHLPFSAVEAFAKLIAAKYEDEIQDLKDMIMELMEQSE